jgi:hypothetical protein
MLEPRTVWCVDTTANTKCIHSRNTYLTHHQHTPTVLTKTGQSVSCARSHLGAQCIIKRHADHTTGKKTGSPSNRTPPKAAQLIRKSSMILCRFCYISFSIHSLNRHTSTGSQGHQATANNDRNGSKPLTHGIGRFFAMRAHDSSSTYHRTRRVHRQNNANQARL